MRWLQTACMGCCPRHMCWLGARFGRCAAPGDQRHPEAGGRRHSEASAEVVLPLPPQT